MKSPVVKRSIVIAGHKTSVSLEDAFWSALKEIAVGRHITLSDLVGAIDAQRQHGNLSSAIRLFVLDHYQARKTDGDETAKASGEADHSALRRISSGSGIEGRAANGAQAVAQPA
jgi:predicted DNA-binding ribbon-helix-helix protein